jgi:hypothetical protein
MIRTLATSQKEREREREREREKSGFFSPKILVKLLLPKSQKKHLIILEVKILSIKEIT